MSLWVLEPQVLVIKFPPRLLCFSGEKRPVEVIKSTMEDHLEKSASKKKKKSFKKNKK
jgi:hypothetical protein